MENSTLSKYSKSFGLSLALCAVFNALLVIAKEKSKDVEDWMQKITGHQWITHVAIVLVLFAVLGWCCAKLNSGEGPKITANHLIGIVFSGVFAGILIILALYAVGD